MANRNSVFTYKGEQFRHLDRVKVLRNSIWEEGTLVFDYNTTLPKNVTLAVPQQNGKNMWDVYDKYIITSQVPEAKYGWFFSFEDNGKFSDNVTDIIHISSVIGSGVISIPGNKSLIVSGSPVKGTIVKSGR